MIFTDIRLIAFDCFGVIVEESAPVWLYRHFDREKADELNKTVVRNGDLGKVSGKETFEIMGRLSGMSGEQVLKDWLSLAERREGTVQAILDLRKTHKTALLSNAIDGLIPGLFTAEELNRLFDYKIVSCEVGCGKPDREIYELLLRQSGIPAQNILFTDDNPKNLEAAEALGIHTILFKNCRQFLTDLEAIEKTL